MSSSVARFPRGCAVALVLGNLAFVYLSAIAPIKRRRFALIPWGLDSSSGAVGAAPL